jgi:hypothetical protein
MGLVQNKEVQTHILIEILSGIPAGFGFNGTV